MGNIKTRNKRSGHYGKKLWMAFSRECVNNLKFSEKQELQNVYAYSDSMSECYNSPCIVWWTALRKSESLYKGLLTASQTGRLGSSLYLLLI